MKKRIGLVNYGCGNLASLSNALRRINADFGYIINADEFKLYDAYILPGVGSFKHGMNSLKQRGMASVLIDEIVRGKDILGICLGMQILFEEGLEGGYEKGLGLVAGSVKRIEVTGGVRVPHMGWNELSREDVKSMRIFGGIDKDSTYYFVHSYSVSCGLNIPRIYTHYCGTKILAAVEYENISAVQFHPEKSHDAGLHLLNNFCNKSG